MTSARGLYPGNNLPDLDTGQPCRHGYDLKISRSAVLQSLHIALGKIGKNSARRTFQGLTDTDSFPNWDCFIRYDLADLKETNRKIKLLILAGF